MGTGKEGGDEEGYVGTSGAESKVRGGVCRKWEGGMGAERMRIPHKEEKRRVLTENSDPSRSHTPHDSNRTARGEGNGVLAEARRRMGQGHLTVQGRKDEKGGEDEIQHRAYAGECAEARGMLPDRARALAQDQDTTQQGPCALLNLGRSSEPRTQTF